MISRAYCTRIAGLWWCHIVLVLVDCVLKMSFRHPAFPGVGWMVLLIAGLLRKASGIID